MKIAIPTDAWHPQVSGVVTKFERIARELGTMGHEVCLITPDMFKTVPCPTYPQIRLALRPGKRIADLFDSFAPDYIHLATEGPIGLAARSYCVKATYPFTTSYTTRFPEYIRLRFPIPRGVTYAVLRWFHNASSAVMVTTSAMIEELRNWGFKNLVQWNLGVDSALFSPAAREQLTDKRPILMYVGRVAVEKNIEDFLNLKIDGTKYVVGDGPDFSRLKAKYPQARFPGYKSGEELARYFASADVFVFPSKTDTFGLVMLEALASGVPVAAYPVRGPLDVLIQGQTGYMDEDLGKAVIDAMAIDRAKCREYALSYTWTGSTKQFFENLALIRRKGKP
ncbi:MAG: glycosyltransferase family 1 protein [Syntrophobacteraceae bacterium]|nr:glycosyltransferase family 1 protein [Syntrophobacteraceae bacterium]